LTRQKGWGDFYYNRRFPRAASAPVGGLAQTGSLNPALIEFVGTVAFPVQPLTVVFVSGEWAAKTEQANPIIRQYFNAI
jgi:hypothetical protein